MISKFVEGTKNRCYWKQCQVQRNFDLLGEGPRNGIWSLIQMCEVLHLGSQTKLGLSQWMREPWRVWQNTGVQVHSFLKVLSQIVRVEKAAFGTLAFINQDIEYRGWDAMLQLHSMLEYCVQLLSLCCRKNAISWKENRKHLQSCCQDLRDWGIWRGCIG